MADAVQGDIIDGAEGDIDNHDHLDDVIEAFPHETARVMYLGICVGSWFTIGLLFHNLYILLSDAATFVEPLELMHLVSWLRLAVSVPRAWLLFRMAGTMRAASNEVDVAGAMKAATRTWTWKLNAKLSHVLWAWVGVIFARALFLPYAVRLFCSKAAAARLLDGWAYPLAPSALHGMPRGWGYPFLAVSAPFMDQLWGHWLLVCVNVLLQRVFAMIAFYYYTQTDMRRGIRSEYLTSHTTVRVLGGAGSADAEPEGLLGGKKECPICFADFEAGEQVRTLECDHVFHTECVDPWLVRQRNECPLCRRAVGRHVVGGAAAAGGGGGGGQGGAGGGQGGQGGGQDQDQDHEHQE